MGSKSKEFFLKRITKINYLHVIAQVFLLIIFTGIGDTKPSCIKLVRQLEQSKNIVDFNGGIWKYFEKHSKLRSSFSLST